MRYHNITKDDMLNGDGLRVVLWVAGCNHCCKECQNPITWDPEGGVLFDEKAKQELFQELEKSYGKEVKENEKNLNLFIIVIYNSELRTIAEWLLSYT